MITDELRRKTNQRDFPEMWSAQLHIPRKAIENTNGDFSKQIIRHKKASIIQEILPDIWNARRYVIQFTEESETINEWTTSKHYGAREGDMVIRLYIRVWAVEEPAPISGFNMHEHREIFIPSQDTRWRRLVGRFKRWVLKL